MLYQKPTITDFTLMNHTHKSVEQGGVIGSVYKVNNNTELIAAFASTDTSITIIIEAAFNWSSATYTVTPSRVQIIGSYYIGIASDISFINNRINLQKRRVKTSQAYS